MRSAQGLDARLDRSLRPPALLAILIVPALATRGAAARALAPLDLALFVAGTGSFALFCAVSQWERRPDGWRAVAGIPLLMAIGIGLSLNNGLGARGGRRADFPRTPRFRMEPRSAGRAGGAGWQRLAYRGPRSPLVVFET